MEWAFSEELKLNDGLPTVMHLNERAIKKSPRRLQIKVKRWNLTRRSSRHFSSGLLGVESEEEVEWAALLVEAGARAVYITHRHDSPAFAEADWSWVSPLVEAIGDDPNWFRRLSQAEKDDVNHRLWAEGRLKVEPWLEARLNTDRVHVLPRTEVMECVDQNGELSVALSNGETIACDQIILATGYKVDITRLPILAAGNILDRLETRNGFPVLDDHFQTSINGLFITSMPATQDFGPFFGFTIAVRVSAKLICEAVATEQTVGLR